MTEKTKELFLTIQNLAESLRLKVQTLEVDKKALSEKCEVLLVQLSEKESLLQSLNQEVVQLKSVLEETQTNLVKESNGSRSNQAIDELVKEIDNYIEQLKK